ncbi:MAG: multidrug ABC transporter substrate-binding protein [Acidobacteria bacterium ACB1]|nr:multidrug ABC transporter substrate-binding protein [Acidobacteria bacterium ACB1]RIJ90731.1 MAG: multidrug ABC transporter substrate-binding protein [Acidobacteriota bacterium]
MRFSTSLPREVLRMAMDSVLSHKFRSVLTILGIVVGIITAIVVASLLTGMRNSIVSIVEDYGSNNIHVYHLSSGFDEPSRDERNRRPLTDADAAALFAQSSSVNDLTKIAPNIGSFNGSFNDNLVYEGKNYRWALTDGVEPNYAQLSNLVLRAGRFITESDNIQRRNVLVIGVNCAEALFPDHEDEAVGKVVRMNGTTWEIIGVIEKRKAAFLGENPEDRKVLMPYRTARKAAPERKEERIIVQVKPGELALGAGDIESILRKRRGLKVGEPNDFDIETAEDMIAQFDGIIGGVGIAAIAISCLGLLVGGIGVMNIMLVSVTERTKEIGIRKALGATRSAIVLQFLLEAMTLTFFGGVIGIVLAIGISTLVMLLVPSLPAQVPLWAIVTGIATSIGVGLIFGVLPARKAAKLDPIECLRYE